MKRYIFIYRGVLKKEIKAYSLTEALHIFSDSTSTVFGIHPLDFDSFYLEDEF